jgi:FKBP-type peptidyl-prolyl cis-trans isomerase FkpA
MRLVVVLASLALVSLACSEGDSGAGSAPGGGGAGGLQLVHEREGTGRSPAATDVVKVHYHGTFTDGRVFDSSVQRGEPASFPLNGVIPCWTQGLQQMKVGGKAKLTCPPELAYGAQGAPPTIPPNATLVFEVELLEIQ